MDGKKKIDLDITPDAWRDLKERECYNSPALGEYVRRGDTIDATLETRLGVSRLYDVLGLTGFFVVKDHPKHGKTPLAISYRHPWERNPKKGTTEAVEIRFVHHREG